MRESLQKADQKYEDERKIWTKKDYESRDEMERMKKLVKEAQDKSE